MVDHYMFTGGQPCLHPKDSMYYGDSLQLFGFHSTYAYNNVIAYCINVLCGLSGFLVSRVLVENLIRSVLQHCWVTGRTSA